MGGGSSVPATITRRLEKLEAVQRAAMQQRFDNAVEVLGRTMAPEHRELIADWMREQFGVTFRLPAGEPWYDILERHQPPALVRAAWLLVAEHVWGGAPVSLAPSVAEVYLADPDAWPMNPCEGCRYPLPVRGRVRPNGSFTGVGGYLGTYPICGLDNHPEEKPAS
jgi:hypothetical protein